MLFSLYYVGDAGYDVYLVLFRWFLFFCHSSLFSVGQNGKFVMEAFWASSIWLLFDRWIFSLIGLLSAYSRPDEIYFKLFIYFSFIRKLNETCVEKCFALGSHPPKGQRCRKKKENLERSRMYDKVGDPSIPLECEIERPIYNPLKCSLHMSCKRGQKKQHGL